MNFFFSSRGSVRISLLIIALLAIVALTSQWWLPYDPQAIDLPSRLLPPGGGQAQIMIRVQKRGGRRFPGVEVRLRTTEGSLYSAGKVLVTDAQGMTRDRLTTRKDATITLNAGGTRYRFQVSLAPQP